MRNLQARQFDAIPTPDSIEDAVKRGMPLVVVAKVTEEQPIIDAIEFEILQAMSRLNLNAALTLKIGQAPVIAKVIFDQFKNESLGDFKLAFLRGSSGLYGEIYRLDGAVLVRWIQCYLEEKYAVVELEHSKMKPESLERVKDDTEVMDPVEFYKQVAERRKVYEKEEAAKKAANVEERKKEALFQMESASHKPVTHWDLVMRDLHDEWIGLHHEKITGKRLSVWMEEAEWLKQITMDCGHQDQIPAGEGFKGCIDCGAKFPVE